MVNERILKKLTEKSDLMILQEILSNIKPDLVTDISTEKLHTSKYENKPVIGL